MRMLKEGGMDAVKLEGEARIRALVVGQRRCMLAWLAFSLSLPVCMCACLCACVCASLSLARSRPLRVRVCVPLALPVLLSSSLALTKREECVRATASAFV